MLILAGGNYPTTSWRIVRRRRSAWWTLWLQVGIPLLAVRWCLVTLLVGGSSTVGLGDFMIATEGEMKKVNWSSRREILGSTKVVILFTVLFAVILFVVDIVFMSFFSGIGVLREAPSVWQMLTGGGS